MFNQLHLKGRPREQKPVSAPEPLELLEQPALLVLQPMAFVHRHHLVLNLWSGIKCGHQYEDPS